MKQQYAVIVLFALIITSSLTSLDSYRTTIAVDTRSKQFMNASGSWRQKMLS